MNVIDTAKLAEAIAAITTPAERHIDASCGCRMHFADAGDSYDTRMEWCAEHEKMAAPLRRILDDMQLVLADLARREKMRP